MTPSLSDIFNAIKEWEFEGTVYKVRPPSVEDESAFTTMLERKDRENAARAVELDDADRERLLRFSGVNAAVGLYEWGTESYTAAMLTPLNFARMLHLILKRENPDKVVTFDLARRMVASEIHTLAVMFQAEAEPDDGVKKNLLSSLGFPSAWHGSRPTSSGGSSPHPTADPPTSNPSGG